MSGLRTLIVNARQWPHVGEAERYLAELAVAWREQGLRPTFLTARWCPTWPRQVTLRGIPLVRLSPAPLGGWATYRYLRQLSRWVREHRDEFDVAFVGNLREEAYAVIGAFAPRPTVLTPRAWGTGGDVDWQRESHQGRRVRRRCIGAAAAVAVCSEASQKELLSAGYDSSRLFQIPLGVEPFAPRDTEQQRLARLCLAAINHDLEAAPYAPVVLCVERLEADRGLSELIQAWKTVGMRWPSARLWIVGDGPERRTFFEQIVEEQLHHQIFLPGSFDALDELFQAADIAIVPSARDEGRSIVAPAMAAGLAVIAVATEESRAMIDSGTDGLLASDNSRGELSTALCRLLESTPRRLQLGEAARRRVFDRLALPTVAAEYVRLFSQVSQGSRRGQDAAADS